MLRSEGKAVPLMKQVDDYFKYQLEQGLSVKEIIETFTQPVLPAELKLTGFTDNQVRRCAQIVSTRRIIDHNYKLQGAL